MTIYLWDVIRFGEIIGTVRGFTRAEAMDAAHEQFGAYCSVLRLPEA